jgi:addiction module HigA family antidote
MIPEHHIPAHPGQILSREFLVPLGISRGALAEHLGVPVQRINELIRGERAITRETATLLAQALNTTPEFWMDLQTAHDRARSRPS